MERMLSSKDLPTWSSQKNKTFQIDNIENQYSYIEEINERIH